MYKQVNNTHTFYILLPADLRLLFMYNKTYE